MLPWNLSELVPNDCVGNPILLAFELSSMVKPSAECDASLIMIGDFCVAPPLLLMLVLEPGKMLTFDYLLKNYLFDFSSFEPPISFISGE